MADDISSAMCHAFPALQDSACSSRIWAVRQRWGTLHRTSLFCGGSSGGVSTGARARARLHAISKHPFANACESERAVGSAIICREDACNNKNGTKNGTPQRGTPRCVPTLHSRGVPRVSAACEGSRPVCEQKSKQKNRQRRPAMVAGGTHVFVCFGAFPLCIDSCTSQ